MKTIKLILIVLFVTSIFISNNLFADDKTKSTLNETKGSNPDTCFFMEEPESDIEIENWMLLPVNVSVQYEVQETEIQVEAWMLQPFKVDSL